jgi:3-hydroxyanthranilate 3,4-dioxygenase
MLLPINLEQWISEHRELLKPPVCNKQIYEMGDFIIMAIGGPNNRKDYHDDPGEELFYQLKGDMVLRVREHDRPRDIPIKEGEMFLLPAHVHHSPQRFADTVGLVIERKRTPDERDGFIWYCDACHAKLHEEFVPLKSIERDLPPLFKRFWDSEKNRTCRQCHHVMPLPSAAT